MGLKPCPVVGDDPDVAEDMATVCEILAASSERMAQPRRASAFRALAKTIRSPSAARVVEALRACLEFIGEEYTDEESNALDGHPIARIARKIWDDGYAALSLYETRGKGDG